MTLQITTNSQPRDLLCLRDYSEAEQQQIRSDYDWMSPEDISVILDSSGIAPVFITAGFITVREGFKAGTVITLIHSSAAF